MLIRLSPHFLILFLLCIISKNSFSETNSYKKNFNISSNRNIKKEISITQQLLDSSFQTNDTSSTAYIHLRLGSLQEIIGQTSKSELNILKAINIFIKYDDKKGLANCYTILGGIYKTKKKINKAFSMHLKAFDLYDELNDSMGLYYVKNNLGINYRMVGDFEKSDKYLKEALEIGLTMANDSSHLILVYNSLGNLYNDDNDYENSLFYYRKGLRIKAKTYIEKEKYGAILNNYGNIFRTLGMTDSSNYYYQKSITHNKIHNFNISLAANYVNKGRNLRIQNKLDSALFYLNTSLEIAIKTKFSQIIQDNYYQLSLLFFQKKDYKRAHYYLSKYARFKDSLFVIGDAYKLAKIEIRLSEKEKDFQLMKNIAENKLIAQNYSYRVNLYISIIISLFVLLILAFVIFRILGKSKKRLSIINEELEERVIERTLNLSFEIDRHKKTEIDLKQNEKRWNRAQEVANVGNWEYSFETQSLWGSKQTFKNLKLKKGKTPVYTRHIFQRIHPDDLKRVSRKLKKLQISNKKLHLEFRLKPTDSNNTFVLVRAEVIYDLNLKPTKISGTIQNITKQKIVENELVKAKEKAEESDRLKSAFLSNMSHEIRTPMNAIIGFSDLLADASFSKEERKEHVRVIQCNSKQLINLIDDIIDIAKIEANQINIREYNCDLTLLMKEIYKTFIHQSHSELELKLNIPEYKLDIIILTDSFRLLQIITNLLSNAFKFTDTGTIEFGYSIKENDMLEFFVRDTGIGISKEAQKIIFERFRQAKDSNKRLYGGTGLGLAICKYMIQLMKGDIWIESETNQGSTFYFTLPYKPLNSLEKENSSSNFINSN